MDSMGLEQLRDSMDCDLVATKQIPDGHQFHNGVGVTRITDPALYRSRLSEQQIQTLGLVNREIVLVPAADLGIQMKNRHTGKVTTDTDFYAKGNFYVVLSKLRE